MPETLTFDTFNLAGATPTEIYEIGTGVLPEMAKAFEVALPEMPTVDSIGDLISKVGPAKELQENIDRVQHVLGTDHDALDIARDWVERSGLLLPANRSLLRSDTEPPKRVELAIITGGVRNWMMRRALRLQDALDVTEVDTVLLVGGNREMKVTEGDDVEEGMRESDYLRVVVKPLVEACGVEVEWAAANTAKGDEVMAHAAIWSKHAEHILVAANAGNWLQGAGQLRRAIRQHQPGYDRNGDQVFVLSDSFDLGETGKEPTATHQNPYTALGQIARNAQEILRHIK